MRREAVAGATGPMPPRGRNDLATTRAVLGPGRRLDLGSNTKPLTEPPLPAVPCAADGVALLAVELQSVRAGCVPAEGARRLFNQTVRAGLCPLRRTGH